MKITYKVDLNVLTSRHYPIALYRKERHWTGLTKWIFIESFHTVAEAKVEMDRLMADLSDLPIYST